LFQEPEWAQYAREKSERARSRTPADPSQHYTPSTTPLPTSYYERQRSETPREFLEKSKTFTHTNRPQYGPPYYQMQYNQRTRGHSEPRETRGYECGGLDYTKGLHFPSVPNEQYLENRRRRGSDVPHTRTGYELGGTDFGKGYTAPGPYRGHGPDPPRLRSRYSADPRSPCNSYYAPNVDEVDANLLVGDTISNQKISHEVRHINQNEFGTSFAPPPGFKRDHITVRRSPPPPEPVTFSISANKSRYGGSVGNLSSSSYQRQHDMWRQSRTPDAKEVTVQTLLNDDVLKKVDRETTPVWHDRSVSKQEAWRHRTDPLHERNQVFTSEPNWSRTVQERRNAWERKAYDTEARLNLPALAKLPPSQPPAWHSKAARTHNVWQAAADTMNAHVQHSCTQPEHQTYETSQTTYSSGAHPYHSQSQYEEQQRHQQQQQQRQSYISSERSEDYSSTAQGVPVQQTYISSDLTNGSNAEYQLNTGYNMNQADYVREHFDKYRAGPKYGSSHYEQMNQSSYSKTYSSTSQQQQQQQHLRQMSTQAYQPPMSTNYQQHQQQQQQQFAGNYNQSSHFTDATRTMPVLPDKTYEIRINMAKGFEKSCYSQDGAPIVYAHVHANGPSFRKATIDIEVNRQNRTPRQRSLYMQELIYRYRLVGQCFAAGIVQQIVFVSVQHANCCANCSTGAKLQQQ
uniref:ZM domain-containing protein n=1 Tax=Angiostrongylus cantonensis TaxID=6313 RepID=A0A0K0D030_ANGCA